MDDWIKHEGTEPPELAPAALVEIERYGRWPQVPKQTRRAAEILWHTGLLYRQLRDEDDVPYISAYGLEPWARYVATDVNGAVLQLDTTPQDTEYGEWLPVATWMAAPATHRHSGNWGESLYRVWRNEMSSARREAFESAVPRPKGVYWDSLSRMYTSEDREWLSDFQATKYHFKFMGWVAAMEYMEKKDNEAHRGLSDDH